MKAVFGQKVNILHINSSAESYGADRALLSLVSTIDKQQFRPIVLVPHTGFLTKKLQSEHISYHVYPFQVLRRADMNINGLLQFIFGFIPSVIYMMRFIKKENIHLVHSNTSVVLPGAIAAKLTGIPHIWHVREIFHSKFRFLERIFKRCILFSSDRVIAVSKAVADQFSSLSKVDVVHDGIDIDYFQSYNHQKVSVQSQPTNHNSHRQFTIGTIGRLNTLKHQQTLIYAFSHVHHTYPDTRLVIVGDVFRNQTQYKEHLVELVQHLHLEPYVTFISHKNDVRPYLQSFDLFVMTSVYEPFGIAALEAMSMSKPVIVSDTGGLPEIVLDQKTGLVFQTKHTADLVAKITYLYRNPKLRHFYATQGKERVNQFFTDHRATNQVEHIFLTVLPSNLKYLPYAEY